MIKKYKKISLHTLFTFTFLVILLTVNGSAQQVPTYKSKEEADKSAGQGVTFKTPDGFHLGQFAGFKGVIMLNLKRPAGIFVSYPNEGESIEGLKKRVLPEIAKMFVRDDEAVKDLEWTTDNIPIHKGDKGSTAWLNLTNIEQQSVQIAIYEREWNDLTFIYGYFAKKINDEKESKDFLDKKGKGVKEFDKFWKTFSGN